MAPNARVRYCVATAEYSTCLNQYSDLIVVAQALHRIDVDRFYADIGRVMKKNGVLRCYQLMQIDSAIGRYIRKSSARTLGPFWPAERKHADDGHNSLPFPFDELAMLLFTIRRSWDLEQPGLYLRSWSAIQYSIEEHSVDAVNPWSKQLGSVRASATERLVTSAISIGVGRTMN